MDVCAKAVLTEAGAAMAASAAVMMVLRSIMVQFLSVIASSEATKQSSPSSRLLDCFA
jgi:hypothetical protein